MRVEEETSRKSGGSVNENGRIVGVDDEEETTEVRNSFEGYAEDGKGKYRSNFPKGTPKKAKGERILHYIQDVWSKKPIPLNITDDAGNIIRTIQAQFDPQFDENDGVKSDASKLMGGNRHGTASEQRVTLDLADDYYQIASEANYNYSKNETGKTSVTHQDVREWHYFVNDIYFAEQGSENFESYTITINVKERNDGQFVYSFSAEKSNKSSTRRTLHADVSRGESSTNAEPVNNSISQTQPFVNPSGKKSAGVRESKKKQVANPEAFNDALRRSGIEVDEGKTVVLDMGSPLHKAIRESGKSASDVIYELIVQHYRSVRFSDGRVAMVDNTDAKEIAKHAGPEKTAEINQLQEIIDNAVLDEADVQADHKKFASFTYYRATVQIGDQKKVILLNIGRGKFDGKDHFYAITNKKRPTAGREALSGAVADPIRSGGSNHSIPQNQEGVKGGKKKESKKKYEARNETAQKIAHNLGPLTKELYGENVTLASEKIYNFRT